MSKRQLLLMSSSRLHGHEFLEHAKDEIKGLLDKNKVTKVLFVPYAQRDHDGYLKTVSKPLNAWGFEVEGLHQKQNEAAAVEQAEAIFIGGGNTFVLLKTLHEKNLIDPLREQVLAKGVPYIGSSAGTNVATRSIHTTNDMPVVYPPTFEALKLVPFNINPHYLDADCQSTHKGETRDQRIEEFIDYNNLPVLGLREGASAFVEGEKMTLLGNFNAKLFNRNKETSEYSPGSDLSFLLNNP